MNSDAFKAAQNTYLRALHVFNEAQYARRHGRLSDAAFRAEEQRFKEAATVYDAAVETDKAATVP